VRTIPSALQTKLDSGVTTLCRCWLIARNDGVRQGFTDHDEDVVIGDVTCRAGSGLSGSEVTAKLGMAVDASEMSGALSDDSLNEDDLAAGRYDAAGVELWLVDWSEPGLKVLLAKGSLGEVRREGTAFAAEMRGLSQKLAEDSGRLFTATCSADLGDARCTVDLANAAYHGSGTVVALSAVSSFTASGLDAFDNGWFIAGKLTFTGGANAGLAMEVKIHGKSGGAGQLHALAGDGAADRGGRHVHRHRRLRQALCDLPFPLRQCRELPRLPAHPRQRFRHQLSGAGPAGQ
jgi:uncharacterized phage protein (TIGR02218 family)